MGSVAQQLATLQTSRHCGAITVTAPQLPPYLNKCQCSICRRYCAQWAYYKVKDILINDQSATTSKRDPINDTTAGSTWGDKSSRFEFCKICGCVMYYWFPVDTKEGEAEIGINARIVTDPMSLRLVEKRITYKDAVKVSEGIHDQNGPARK